MSGDPSATPSSRNCTLVTPTLSLAVAETVTAVPLTVAPPAGAVTVTVGGVASAPPPFDTVTATPADVAVLLAASLARALRVCAPSVAAVESQVML